MKNQGTRMRAHGADSSALYWLWNTRKMVRPNVVGQKKRPTLEGLEHVNFEPRNADEAVEALRQVADHFLAMSPRHPLGYFPDVYGREMTRRARQEALEQPGHKGYFRGSEYANYVFIGQFASLYLKDLRLWLLANQGESVQTEFGAWHLSFEYCQFNYEREISIPLVEACTGFIPHIVNDLGHAFALTTDELQRTQVPVDMPALRESHWNVSHLLKVASESTLERYAYEMDCPLGRLMLASGVEKTFPRMVLWALMDLRVRAWYDFLELKSHRTKENKKRLHELDRKAKAIQMGMLAFFGDPRPHQWKFALHSASFLTRCLDTVASMSSIGARLGMPAPDTPTNPWFTHSEAWWSPAK